MTYVLPGEYLDGLGVPLVYRHQHRCRNLPNCRIRAPYVRWCGRRGAARSLPIPITPLGGSTWTTSKAL